MFWGEERKGDCSIMATSQPSLCPATVLAKPVDLIFFDLHPQSFNAVVSMPPESNNCCSMHVCLYIPLVTHLCTFVKECGMNYKAFCMLKVTQKCLVLITIVIRIFSDPANV